MGVVHDGEGKVKRTRGVLASAGRVRQRPGPRDESRLEAEDCKAQAELGVGRVPRVTVPHIYEPLAFESWGKKMSLIAASAISGRAVPGVLWPWKN